jgi:hypothetical protein
MTRAIPTYNQITEQAETELLRSLVRVRDARFALLASVQAQSDAQKRVR